MNISKEYESELLDRLSHEKAVDLIPTSLYVMVMMVVGLCGNIMVCVFYNKRVRTSPTTRLIVAVAVIDSIICILMPKNVADLSLSYKFTSSALCRLNNFVNHITAISSTMVLVAVSAFRYRAVCKPLSSQFSLRHANIAILIAVIGSFLMATPVLVTHESVAINVTVNSDLKITGYDCNTSKKPSLKPFNLFVNVFYFFIFIASTTVFVVLYSMMGRSILRYYRRKTSLSESATTSVQLTSDSTGRSEIDNESHDDKAEPAQPKMVDYNRVNSASEMIERPSGEQSAIYNDITNASADVANFNITVNETNNVEKRSDIGADVDNTVTKGEPKHAIVTFDKEHTKTEEPVKTKHTVADKKAEQNISAVAVKQTVMLFVITVIFFLSYLPYLVMNISRSLSKNKDGDADFTNWIQFCTRSYLINSAANSFVYGLFNTDFRAFVKKILCRCCSRQLMGLGSGWCK